MLAAAQLLLAIPAMASANAAAGSACDHAGMSSDHGCPCCPDDANSMSGCLAYCLLGTAVAPSLLLVFTVSHVSQEFADAADFVPTVADPPVKPPPIA